MFFTVASRIRNPSKLYTTVVLLQQAKVAGFFFLQNAQALLILATELNRAKRGLTPIPMTPIPKSRLVSVPLTAKRQMD